MCVFCSCVCYIQTAKPFWRIQSKRHDKTHTRQMRTACVFERVIDVTLEGFAERNKMSKKNDKTHVMMMMMMMMMMRVSCR